MDLVDFQQDLKNGMSIAEALKKYNITLEYAMNHVNKPITEKHSKLKPSCKPHKKLKICTVARYIQQIENHFYVRKQVNGKMRPFGSYSSLEDAIKLRDYCMEHGWKQRKVDKYCEILGIKRCSHWNSKVRYH